MSKSKIEQALTTYGNRLCKDVERTWQSFNSIEGEANINFEIVPTNNNELTIGRIEATGQKAWIAEYGKGSLMSNESENPCLSKYKNNPRRWNTTRKGNFVTGRLAGKYKDLDNNSYISSGKLAGRNLESIYKPSKPYNVVRKNVTKKGASRELFKHSLKNIIREQINIEVKHK